MLLATLLFAAAADPLPLFNGKDLTGWTVVTRDPKPGVDPKTTFTVNDGEIRCSGKPNGYLATVAEYGDITLTLKWKYPAGAAAPNTGVLLFVGADDRKTWPASVEVQLKHGFAGDFWMNLPPAVTLDVPAVQRDPKAERHVLRLDPAAKIEKPLGEWNEMTIVTKAGAITVTVNGAVTNRANGGSLKKGRIALQSEGAEVAFKDVNVLLR